ncbi:MAG: hypothetical protein WC889_07695 [Myxococcota bacterium]|jgi:hypothetical protein
MKKMIAVVVLSVMLAAASAQAEGISMFSGQTLGSPKMALNVGAGVPDVSVLFLAGLNKDMDLGGFFKLGYLSPVLYMSTPNYDPVMVYFNPGVSFRYSIRNWGKYNLGFIGEAGFLIGAYPDFNFGLNINPSIVFGIPIKDVVSINLGFGIPFNILFVNNVVGMIPLAFKIGAEFFIDPKLSVNFNTEMGPGICAYSGGSDVGFYGLFKAGITFGL